MTRSTSLDDDLLPLSAFASSDFSALELVKKRLLISQGEMSKLITDYERATSIELVSLVNDHYKDFLSVAQDVRQVSESIVSVRESLPPKYVTAKREIESSVFKSSKMQNELLSLSDSRTDVGFLKELCRVLQSLDSGVQVQTGSMVDFDIISREFERVHTKIEAMEAVLAAGMRRGSTILRESLPVIREELARIRSELATKLLGSLESGDAIDEIYACLSRIQAEQKLVQLLKSKYGSRIVYSPSEDVSDFLDRISSNILGPSSPFGILSKSLEPYVDVVDEVVVSAMISELSSKAPMSVFVPTASSLDSFYRNYMSVKNFPRMHADFISKFKLSIYLSLHIKRVSESVSMHMSDRSRIGQILESDLLIPTVIVDESCVGKVVQYIVSLFSQLRENTKGDWTSHLRGDDLMIDFLIPSIRDKLSSFVAKKSALAEIFMIEHVFFSRSKTKVIFTIVTEQSTPIIQTLDSVKQIPALYRVASRGPPTRHSVYVDLVIKALSKLQAPEFELVRTEIVSKCITAFGDSISDLLAKEKGKGKSGEGEKIRAQVSLDVFKFSEFVKSNFGNVNLESLEKYSN